MGVCELLTYHKSGVNFFLILYPLLLTYTGFKGLGFAGIWSMFLVLFIAYLGTKPVFKQNSSALLIGFLCGMQIDQFFLPVPTHFTYLLLYVLLSFFLHYFLSLPPFLPLKDQNFFTVLAIVLNLYLKFI